jgi:hypothetical protein
VGKEGKKIEIKMTSGKPSPALELKEVCWMLELVHEYELKQLGR